MSHINNIIADYVRDSFPCGKEPTLENLNKLSTNQMDELAKQRDVKITQEALDKAADNFAKKQARLYTPTFSEVYHQAMVQLLPSFIHLPPDEAAKAAINYAKELIKELER